MSMQYAGQGDAEVVLRTLAERLLSRYHPWIAEPALRDTVERALSLTHREPALRIVDPEWFRVPLPYLLPGRLPPDLSVPIPLPEGTRILGSILSDREGELNANKQDVTMVLDIPLTPRETDALFRQRLTAAGWRTVDDYEADRDGTNSAPGFTYEDPTALPDQFIWGPSGHTLRLRAHTIQQRLTELRLYLAGKVQATPYERRRRMYWRRSRGHSELFPTLTAPPSAIQLPGGSSWCGDWGRSTASLETDLDLALIASHYAQLLEDHGWSCHSSQQDGPLAWSSWTFQDHGAAYEGFFSVLRRPWTPREHALEVLIHHVGAGEGPARG